MLNQDLTTRRRNHQLPARPGAVVGRTPAARARWGAELMADFDHAFRTPLTSVVGYTEVLLSGDTGALHHEQVLMLQRVEQNGKRLLVLVENFLQLTKRSLDSGASIDPADVLRQLVEAPSLAQGDLSLAQALSSAS